MRVYFAGPYSQRLTLLERAEELIRLSNDAIEITSTWLRGEHEAQDGVATVEEMARWADQDMDDIDRSDILVQFTEHPSTRGGAHVEFGYAAGIGINAIVCGPVGNVFHAAIGMRFNDWPATRSWLIEFVGSLAA